MSERHELSEADKVRIFPEAHSTIQAVFDFLNANPKETSRSYGHGIGMVGAILYANCELEHSIQRERFKVAAEHLLEKYGPEIVHFMKPELKEALGIKDDK